MLFEGLVMAVRGMQALAADAGRGGTATLDSAIRAGQSNAFRVVRGPVSPSRGLEPEEPGSSGGKRTGASPVARGIIHPASIRRQNENRERFGRQQPRRAA